MYGIISALLIATAWGANPPVCTTGICDSCFSPRGSCDAKLVSFIDSAKDTLEIAIYNLTMEEIADAITRAKTRGVHVRLIADYKLSLHYSSLIGQLRKKGIPVKTWNGENDEEGIMHHKFSIVDGRVLQTGSYNYSFMATARNAENQLYIGDQPTVARYRGEFDRLWNELK